jgi:hypothetical protein
MDGASQVCTVSIDERYGVRWRSIERGGGCARTSRSSDRA